MAVRTSEKKICTLSASSPYSSQEEGQGEGARTTRATERLLAVLPIRGELKYARVLK